MSDPLRPNEWTKAKVDRAKDSITVDDLQNTWFMLHGVHVHITTSLPEDGIVIYDRGGGVLGFAMTEPVREAITGVFSWRGFVERLRSKFPNLQIINISTSFRFPEEQDAEAERFEKEDK